MSYYGCPPTSESSEAGPSARRGVRRSASPAPHEGTDISRKERLPLAWSSQDPARRHERSDVERREIRERDLDHAMMLDRIREAAQRNRDWVPPRNRTVNEAPRYPDADALAHMAALAWPTASSALRGAPASLPEDARRQWERNLQDPALTSSAHNPGVEPWPYYANKVRKQTGLSFPEIRWMWWYWTGYRAPHPATPYNGGF